MLRNKLRDDFKRYKLKNYDFCIIRNNLFRELKFIYNL